VVVERKERLVEEAAGSGQVQPRIGTRTAVLVGGGIVVVVGVVVVGVVVVSRYVGTPLVVVMYGEELE